jgi:hypothetical protein
MLQLMRVLRGPHGLNTWLPVALDANVWASLKNSSNKLKDTVVNLPFSKCCS